MEVHVPFAPRDPKSRLAPRLDADEREALAAGMLSDVAGAVERAGHEPVVVTTAAPEELDDGSDTATALRAHRYLVDDRPLDAAVGALLDAPPTAVVMSDLALATPDAVERLLAAGGDVALAPGLRGGTNAFVAREADFAVDYHGASFRDHRRIADEAGLDVAVVDSFRLAVDVDEPGDLVEVHLHGEGRAGGLVREWFGIDEAAEDGRIGLDRRG